MTDMTAYLSGAFGGICLLVMLLSLLVGQAYRERMLWWHAGTVGVAVAAQFWQNANPALAATLWTLQLALASQTLRATGGGTGAVHRAGAALQALSIVLAVVAASRLLPEPLCGWMLLPWAAITLWYLVRIRPQSGLWFYWLAAGQLALGLQGLLSLSLVPGLRSADPKVGSLAALALFAISVYLAMVWHSRLRTENKLRVEARERTDPLTGLAMPRVFFDRVDGALIRSRDMGYASALVLIRVENIDKIVAEQQFDSNEAVILAASRAIGSTLRAQDSAARLASNRFAVLAEGIGESDSNALATRILAHGMRAGEWGLQGSELQFQIAVVEIGQTDAQARSILRQLEGVLKQMSAHRHSQHICTLPPITGARPA